MLHLQTLEFWPISFQSLHLLSYPSKHWNSYTLPNIGTPLVLLLSNIWIFILSFNWNIAFLILPSRTLEFPSYTYNHQKSYLFLPNIGILFLSFQTLEFWLYPSEHLNSYLIVRIIGILVLFFQQWSSYLIFQSTGILVLSFQTFEFL